MEVHDALPVKQDLIKQSFDKCGIHWWQVYITNYFLYSKYKTKLKWLDPLSFFIDSTS